MLDVWLFSFLISHFSFLVRRLNRTATPEDKKRETRNGKRETISCRYVSLCLLISAAAQSGVRGQIFLPGGEPVHGNMRFTLATDDGARTDILFTDSNGRIAITPPVNVPYTITVEGDGETFDTTRMSFNPAYSGRYITIHLRPFTPRGSSPPGVVDVSVADQNVSPKAREAYEEALSSLKTQQYDQAVMLLKRAVSLQPNYFHAYNDLGVLYMRLKQLDLAADALRHAIRINGKIYIPQVNLGIVLNRQGKHREAAEVLGRIDRSTPELAVRINPPMIEALMGAQQWARAEQELLRGLSLRTADAVDLKIKLGLVMIRQGKAGAAVSILEEACKAEPDNALAQFNLGAALLQSGSLDRAEGALWTAYRLKGSEMAGAQLLLGDLYFQKKDYPKALEAFKAYLKDLPDAPNAAQVREAIEELRQVVKK
jgi:Flp pilus assembly protein TadD